MEGHWLILTDGWAIFAIGCIVYFIGCMSVEIGKWVEKKKEKKEQGGLIMKARVKATGKLLNNVIPIMSVDNKVVMFHEYGTENDYYYYEDLDFSNTIDWEQMRIQVAIAAMQEMLANPQTFEQLDHDKGYQEIRGGDKSQIVAIASVMYADALIAELKKGVEE